MARRWIALIAVLVVVSGCAERTNESPALSEEDVLEVPMTDVPSSPLPAEGPILEEAPSPPNVDSSTVSEERAEPTEPMSAAPTRPQDFRAAMSQCDSDLHEQAVDQALSRRLDERSLEQTRLWSGIASAYRDCGNDKVIKWVHETLEVDLAPDAYRHVVRIALALDEPSMDARLMEIAADQSRTPSVAAEILEGYAFRRAGGFEGMPELIASSYKAGRLSPVFVEQWVPLLLAAESTRDRLAQLGSQALIEDPGLPGGDLLFEILTIDVHAYSYRFDAASRASVEPLLEAYSPVWRQYQFVARKVDAARALNESFRGQRVAQRPLDWRLEWTGEVCRAVWPERLAAAVDEVAEGVVLMTGDGDCGRAGFVVADFDGDGSEDVVLKGSTDGTGLFLLVVNGRAPYARVLGPADHGSYVEPIEAGYYSLDGCFNDVLDDRELFLRQDGFVLVRGEYSWKYMHFEGYRLVGHDPGIC